MTWKEFKAAVEKHGVLDTDYIDYIDIGSPEDVEVSRDACDNSIAITTRYV